MSRIRTIKPESSISEPLEATSILAALLFARLPCFADDEGRMRYSAARVKAQVFPMRDEVSQGDCERAVRELEGKGLVRVYMAAGAEYLAITGFAEHQKVNRPQPSQIPAPPDVQEGGIDTPAVANAAGPSVGSTYAAHEDNPGKQPSTCICSEFSERSVSAHGRKRKGKRKRNGKGNPQAPCASDAAQDAEREDRADPPPFHLQCLDAFNRITGSTVGRLHPSEAECLEDHAADYTPDEVAAMVEMKRRQWADKPELARWIRPATLFSRRHFVEYMEELKIGTFREGERDGKFAEYAD